MYDSNIGRWMVQDPLTEKYYSQSPYNYCVNNPVMFVDPDGLEWFYYREKDDDEAAWHWRNESTYNTGVKDENGKEIILQGHNAVVVFNGSMDERLGEGDNLFGAGAILADVTVYGPKGADDIGHYKGFTMSSDYAQWGAIADGEYIVNYDPNGKSGSLKSNWTLNNRGKVPALNDYNPSPYRSYERYKTGIFIHSSNRNGYAGNYIKNGKSHGISEGCLLIAPSIYNGKSIISPGWDQFNQQLNNEERYLLQLIRK